MRTIYPINLPFIPQSVTIREKNITKIVTIKYSNMTALDSLSDVSSTIPNIIYRNTVMIRAMNSEGIGHKFSTKLIKNSTTIIGTVSLTLVLDDKLITQFN